MLFLHKINAVSGPISNRYMFRYHPHHSAKFINYFGLDLSICKFRGRVLVMLEKSLVKKAPPP